MLPLPQPNTQILAVAVAAVRHTNAGEGPPLDTLMLLGFLACIFNVLCIIEQHQRTLRLVVALLISCTAVSIFAIEAGAWPVALIEIALGLSGVQRFRSRDGHHPFRRRFSRKSKLALSRRITHLNDIESPWAWN